MLFAGQVPEWAGDELDVAERIDSLNSNPALSVNLDLDELDEPDGMDLDEDQLAAATDEVRHRAGRSRWRHCS